MDGSWWKMNESKNEWLVLDEKWMKVKKWMVGSWWEMNESKKWMFGSWNNLQ